MIKILMGGMAVWVGMIGIFAKKEEMCSVHLLEYQIFLCKLLYKVCSKAQQVDYLGPSFSNTLGPCSCHSCFEIHMFSLSAICAAVKN